MTEIIICGAGGRMGQTVAALARTEPERFSLAAGADKFADPKNFDFPVFEQLDGCGVKGGVVIDFSRPDALSDVLAFCRKNRCGAVLGTTGYTPAQRAEIEEAAQSIPIFQTFNLSIGIALLSKLVREASEFLGEAFEVEIVERHHDQKADAPSGTALMLAGAVAGRTESDYVYGRQGRACKRAKREIGIHAVRGGTVVGEHEVLFLGHDEEITLAHRAQSKAVFAQGALRAAEFLRGKPAGKYDMDDYLRETL